jgi:hypothetical protein
LYLTAFSKTSERTNANKDATINIKITTIVIRELMINVLKINVIPIIQEAKLITLRFFTLSIINGLSNLQVENILLRALRITPAKIPDTYNISKIE